MLHYFRKKSTASASSFVVLDESQELEKPTSASIGTSPIFVFPECHSVCTEPLISIPVGEEDWDCDDVINDVVNDEKDIPTKIKRKENILRSFWRRATAERTKLIDELNDSSGELEYLAEEQETEAEYLQKRYERLYAAVVADIEGDAQESDQEEGEESADRSPQEQETKLTKADGASSDSHSSDQEDDE